MASLVRHMDEEEVSEVVEWYPLTLDGLSSIENVNILQLGLYDVLIGMD